MRPYLSIILVLCVLAACTSRETRISDNTRIAFSDSRDSDLVHGMAVGEVSGGDMLLNQSGLTDGDFRSVMMSMLKRNALLADHDTARWRLDCILDFVEPGRFSATQSASVRIKYVLRDATTGDAVLEKLKETSGTASMQFIGGNISAVTGTMGALRGAALDLAIQRNLNWFIAVLSAWDKDRQPAG